MPEQTAETTMTLAESGDYKKVYKKILAARKKAGFDDNKEFNDAWKHVFPEYSALTKFPADRIEDLMAWINSHPSEEEEAPVEEPEPTPEPVAETEPEVPSAPEPTPQAEPEAAPAPEKPPAEAKKKFEWKDMPIILLGISSYWYLRRLIPLIVELQRSTKHKLCYRIAAKLGAPKSTSDNFSLEILKTSKTWAETPDGASKLNAEVLVLDDPSNPHTDRFRGKLRVSVQPTRINSVGKLAAGIRNIDHYFCWSKDDKNALKRIGVPGQKIVTMGSVWLSYLNGLIEDNKVSHKKIALLFAPNRSIPYRAYWAGSGVLKMLMEADYKIKIVKWMGITPNWVPDKVEVLDDFDVQMDAIPSLAVATPEMILPEMAALKVPILRLPTGRLVRKDDMRKAIIEFLPPEIITPHSARNIAKWLFDQADRIKEESRKK